MSQSLLLLLCSSQPSRTAEHAKDQRDGERGRRETAEIDIGIKWEKDEEQEARKLEPGT